MFKWFSLLVLIAGLSGVYFGLRALIALSWIIAFNLVIVLLCIIGVIVGITAYGFIVLGGKVLVKENQWFIILLPVLGIIAGWRLSDIALISVSGIALVLFTSLSLTLPYFKIPLRLVKAVAGVALVVGLVLLVVNVLLPVISCTITGWGLKPVFNGNTVYVPGPIGYRSLNVNDVVTRIDVNGSRILLYTTSWGVIEGFVEKIAKWILWITTRLGKITLNLEEFKGQVNIEYPPKPAPSQVLASYNGPPPLVIQSIKLSSTITTHLSPVLLVALNIVYGFILVTVGLLILGKEV